MTSITGNSSSDLWGQAVGLGLRPKKKKITLRWANYDAKDPSSYFEMDIPYETFLNKDGNNRFSSGPHEFRPLDTTTSFFCFRIAR